MMELSALHAQNPITFLDYMMERRIEFDFTESLISRTEAGAMENRECAFDELQRWFRECLETGESPLLLLEGWIAAVGAGMIELPNRSGSPGVLYDTLGAMPSGFTVARDGSSGWSVEFPPRRCQHGRDAGGDQHHGVRRQRHERDTARVTRRPWGCWRAARPETPRPYPRGSIGLDCYTTVQDYFSPGADLPAVPLYPEDEPLRLDSAAPFHVTAQGDALDGSAGTYSWRGFETREEPDTEFRLSATAAPWPLIRLRPARRPAGLAWRPTDLRSGKYATVVY